MTLVNNGTVERIFRKWQLWDEEQIKLRTIKAARLRNDQYKTQLG